MVGSQPTRPWWVHSGNSSKAIQLTYEHLCDMLSRSRKPRKFFQTHCGWEALLFLREGKAFPGDTRRLSLTWRDASVLQCLSANHVWPWARGSLGSGSNGMFPRRPGLSWPSKACEWELQAIRGPERKPHRILPWVGVRV